MVRLLTIKMENIKSVSSGNFSMPNSKENEGFSESADILGIYGQNGSGKTAVIDILHFLKKIILGNSLIAQTPSEKNFYNIISVDSESANLEFKFSIDSGESKFIVTYICSISKKTAYEPHCFFSAEKLQVSKYNGTDWSKTVDYFNCKKTEQLLDTEFLPANRLENILGGIGTEDRKFLNSLIEYQMTIKNATSFLFSDAFFSLVKNSDQFDLATIISSLKNYADKYLHIILANRAALLGLNVVIPVLLKNTDSDKSLNDTIINITQPMVMPRESVSFLQKNLKNMNYVFTALVPGLSFEVKEYGEELLQNGKTGVKFEVVSKRNDKEISIRYESEGILKIFSIINYLVLMYNNPSVLVAIDELDSGIFEALLGDFLGVIEETGKGQLIFTSHNLRPLEILDSKNIIFTTTNPNNRFIKLNGVKPTNNVRDMYIRAVKLGGQKEELVTNVKESAIRRGLMKAGDDD